MSGKDPDRDEGSAHDTGHDEGSHGEESHGSHGEEGHGSGHDETPDEGEESPQQGPGQQGPGQHRAGEQGPGQQQPPRQQSGAAAPQGRPPQAGPAQDSIGDILNRASVQDRLKYAIAVYGILGVGMGLSGFLLGELYSSSGGQFGLNVGQALASYGVGALVLVGPVVAAVVGMRLNDSMDQESRAVYAASFVGNAIGDLLMTVLGFLLIAGTVNGLELGDALVPLFAVAIVTGVVGVGVVWAKDFTG